MNAPAQNTRAGQPTPLVDGIEKVTGKALYTADLETDDSLSGRILRSPVSHARIIRIDTSKAEALEGVAAVITGADCPHTFGVIPIAMNEYPMAWDKVRYRGEPIAAVAARDADTADRALNLIEVEFEQLKACYTIKGSTRVRMPNCCTMTSGQYRAGGASRIR